MPVGLLQALYIFNKWAVIHLTNRFDCVAELGGSSFTTEDMSDEKMKRWRLDDERTKSTR